MVNQSMQYIDGIIGQKTIDKFLNKIKSDNNLSQHIITTNTVFSCPHCGGNQITINKGKRICAFCGSEIIIQI